MQLSNYEPRRRWSAGGSPRSSSWLDEMDDDYLCLSCGAFSGQQAFCRGCRERSRQLALTDWDDLGVAD